MKIWNWPKDRSAVEQYFARVEEASKPVEQSVDAIIAAVRARGDAALAEYTLKFDKVAIAPGEFAVPSVRLKAAWDAAPAKLKSALRIALKRIKAYHETQKLSGHVFNEPGFGVYVPAGEAPLVSTVLMDVIPARVAGVKEIYLFTPPQRDGWPDPGILAAAHLAGVTQVFRLGSAWAVAAAAFGTQSGPRVDKVVGPGNAYVTTAKQRLYGKIDIESTAGPSEVLIIADDSAPPEYIAADLLAQAEHAGDNPCGALLIGANAGRARALEAEVQRQAALLSRSELARRSIENHGYIITVKTAAQAIALANQKAPEHLEIIARGARALARKVTTAGAIFVGPWTPEPVGDYIAGPNHTLPTGGSARFFSPLSTWSFYRTSHTIEATRSGLESLAGAITTLAEAEQLTAHAESVRVRLKKTK